MNCRRLETIFFVRSGGFVGKLSFLSVVRCLKKNYFLSFSGDIFFGFIEMMFMCFGCCYNCNAVLIVCSL